MDSFRTLGISESILKAIKDLGFEKPTYIQEKSIPSVLKGEDVIGQSSTGSGKTLAFGSAIIQNLERGHGIRALVLTPTRELAEQVCEALEEFSKYKQLRIATVYGGVSINPQIHALQKADVVVATPGRLLDHLSRNTIDLSNIQILVLDEADRMVDMGFIDDVNKIVKKCPNKRQTLLFSATMSPDIEKIKHRYMNNPKQVLITKQVDPSKLKQVYYDVRNFEKFSLLVHLLSQEHSGTVMVFCNTRREVDAVTRNLKKQNFDAIAIHGGYTQAKRSSTMDKIHAKKVTILVCTDVAARGIDIDDVSHIYNYDIPSDSKDYVHRIGRTARAGKEGKVINLLTDRDHNNFSSILRDYSQLKIKNEPLPKFETIPYKRNSYNQQNRRSSGRGSRRRGKSKSSKGRRRKH